MTKVFFIMLDKFTHQSGEEPFKQILPLKKHKDIVPISTVEDLFAEGVFQSHCCAVFAKQIENGNLCFYRILKPERSTLSLSIYKKTDNQIKVKIQEFRGKNNSILKQKTWYFIKKWLKSETSKFEHINFIEN